MSAFLELRDLVVNALLATPALCGGQVRAGRNTPVQTDVAAAINVALGASRGQMLDFEGLSMQWETEVMVSIYARAAAGVDADQACDPFLGLVWERLLALELPTGAMGATLDPAIQRDTDEADQTLGAAHLRLRITHLTTGAALAAA